MEDKIEGLRWRERVCLWMRLKGSGTVSIAKKERVSGQIKWKVVQNERGKGSMLL